MVQYGLKVISKKHAIKAKNDRKTNREAKERSKSRARWLQETRLIFQEYIRARDHGKPCISCGSASAWQYHAGHYQTVASRPGLQFHPSNCNLQCSRCNTHLSANIHGYRETLIQKVGYEMVDYLETAHPWSGWSIEEIKEIKTHYRQLIKGLNQESISIRQERVADMIDENLRDGTLQKR